MPVRVVVVVVHFFFRAVILLVSQPHYFIDSFSIKTNKMLKFAILIICPSPKPLLPRPPSLLPYSKNDDDAADVE